MLPQLDEQQLLSALTEQFKANDFDVQYLLQAICNSDAYQRTSVPVSSNSEDHQLYSHRNVRAMLPEQLYDSVVTVIGNEKGGRKGDAAKSVKRSAR